MCQYIDNTFFKNYYGEVTSVGVYFKVKISKILVLILISLCLTEQLEQIQDYMHLQF